MSEAATFGGPVPVRTGPRRLRGPTLLTALALLLATLIPIVLLSKPLAKLVDHGIGAVGLPSALGGVVIATASKPSTLRISWRQSVNLRSFPCPVRLEVATSWKRSMP